MVSEGRGDNRPHWYIRESTDSLQDISNLPPFDCELMFIVDMLISAASAPTEVGAFRSHPMRRALLNVDYLRFAEFLFFADDFRQDRFAIDREGNKKGLAVFPSDTFSAEGDIFDF